MQSHLDIQVTTPTNSSSYIKMNLNFSNRLGKGAYATVYLGEVIGTGEKLAIKKMGVRTDIIDTNIEKEIAIMEQFTNSNATNLMTIHGYAYYQDAWQAWNCIIAMPFAANGPLSKWLNTPCQLTPEGKFNIVVGIATGLSFMHQKEVFHCDLKPDNVLLTDTMKPLLCDFGLSQRKGIEELERAVGSPYYMSPSILLAYFRRNHHVLSEKDDLYSFAIVCWCIYAQEPSPFKKIFDYKELVTRVCDNNDRESIQEDWPSEIKELITNGWDSVPEKRWSADEALIKLTGVPAPGLVVNNIPTTVTRCPPLTAPGNNGFFSVYKPNVDPIPIPTIIVTDTKGTVHGNPVHRNPVKKIN